MNKFMFKWDCPGYDETMVAEVYANTSTEAEAVLDIDEEEKATLKLVRVEPYSEPRVGDIKFYGTYDDYLENLETD
jgi:hypothetical protein